MKSSGSQPPRIDWARSTTAPPNLPSRDISAHKTKRSSDSMELFSIDPTTSRKENSNRSISPLWTAGENRSTRNFSSFDLPCLLLPKKQHNFHLQLLSPIFTRLRGPEKKYSPNWSLPNNSPTLSLRTQPKSQVF